MRHADRLIERILYLEGVPNVQRLGKVQRREDRASSSGSISSSERPRRPPEPAMELCRGQGDNGTRDLLDDILKGEEHSADELEAHLGIIKDVGKENYLAQMFNS